VPALRVGSAVQAIDERGGDRHSEIV
jgi:hypothetical protein